MFDEATRKSLAKSLHDCSVHNEHNDLSCAICGKKGGKLALHVFQYAQDQNMPTPKGFVPMSASFGTIRGTFPVCEKCAPACSKCKLPIPSQVVSDFMGAKKKELSGDYSLMYGNGVCTQHIQWGLLFKALFRKMFSSSKK